LEKNPRKKYVGFTGTILTEMDKHIIICIKENMRKITVSPDNSRTPERGPSGGVLTEAENKKDKYTSNVYPEKAFNDFCICAIETIRVETELLITEENMDEHAVKLKMKKTYKNRYQTIRKKLAETIHK
jgi:hypothetical protein